jgi:excisionase family DNA binding protein
MSQRKSTRHERNVDSKDEDLRHDQLRNPSRNITNPAKGRSHSSTTHYEPSGSALRRPLWRPATERGNEASTLCADRPSGGRLWHGFAVRRPLLGGGGGALIAGPPDLHREPLGGHPIHVPLSPAVQDVATKTEGRTFFTERTLAAYLAVSDRTIRNWIRRGELPSYKLGASRRIDPADVEDFLVRHRDEAA